MGIPDFEQARRYALRRLERELSPKLTYHNLEHTRDDVVPATERLADWEKIGRADLLLLSTAAYYHDIGFVLQRVEHEAASSRLAAQILPGFGYGPEQIQIIHGLIMATRLPQTPHTLLEQMIVDADLDSLGRGDFLERSHALRDELGAFGQPIGLDEWYRRQLEFLQSHRYFTAAARALRDDQKTRNIEMLRELLWK